ncbi:zinc finger mym-type protein 1-like protein, partial [Lasius niger]
MPRQELEESLYKDVGSTENTPLLFEGYERHAYAGIQVYIEIRFSEDKKMSNVGSHHELKLNFNKRRYCVAISNVYDIGRYIGATSDLSCEEKVEVFMDTWVPEKSFNFKKIGEKRNFRFEWLQTYAPWLAYSEVADGAFCKFCVLFKQK